MRTKRSLGTGLYGALLLGLAGGSLGCSQLWRPFLQDVEAPEDCSNVGETGCDPRCDRSCGGPDLGVGESDLGGSAEWEVIPTGITSPLRAVWGLSNEQRIYIGGDSAVLLSLQPGGQSGGQLTQETLASGARFGITAITGDPLQADPTPQAIVAVGTDNTLLYFGGTGWVQRNPGTTLDGYRGVAYPVGTAAWFGGGASGAGVAYYGRPAGPYTAATVPNAKAIGSAWPADQNSVWFGAEQGTLYRSYSGATTAYQLSGLGNVVGIWGNNATGMSLPPACDFGTSCTCDGGFCSSSRFWAVQTSGTVTRFDLYGGFTVEPRPKAPPAVVHTAIYGNASGQIWVTGQRGAVLHYDGREWNYLDVGTSVDLYGVWVAPGSKRPWLVGDNGLLMRRRP